MKKPIEEYEKLQGLELSEYKRMAGRNLEQFKADIEKGHKVEREVIDRYAKYYKLKTGKELSIIDNGIDNSGAFLRIEDVKDDADYIVNGKPMEVKVIKNDLFNFRLKLNLIKSYIRQNANMIIVLGWETDNPVFTILDKEELKHMAVFGKKNVSGDWEGKPTVTVYKNSYEWSPLPKLNA